MQSELKPCPFCGSDKHMLLSPTCDRSTPYNPADRAFPVIRCSGCYTDVPGRDFDASGKSAVEAWNRRTALSAEQTQPVAVKALEWIEHGDLDFVWHRANPPIGPRYNIEDDGFSEKKNHLTVGQLVLGNFETLEAAKAAAQSDYEQRILSAICGGARHV